MFDNELKIIWNAFHLLFAGVNALFHAGGHHLGHATQVLVFFVQALVFFVHLVLLESDRTKRGL